MVSQLTYKDYLKITIPFMLATATQPILGAVANIKGIVIFK